MAINAQMVNVEIRLIENRKADLGDTFDFKTPIDRIQEDIELLKEAWNTDNGDIQLDKLKTAYGELEYTKIATYLRYIKSADVKKSTYWKNDSSVVYDL